MSLYQDKYRIESTRLRGWDYRSRGWYFVTICAQRHGRVFGEVENGEVRLSAIGRIAELELQTLASHYDNVHIDEHVVMPNHVHAIVMIGGEHCFSPNAQANLRSTNVGFLFASPQAGSLSAIVRSYKAGVTRQCHELGLEQVIWQPRFHDHLLRGDKVISAVREYIRNNPVNWKGDREAEFLPR
jgi:REP element-mobilizing transposase RayT